MDAWDPGPRDEQGLYFLYLFAPEVSEADDEATRSRKLGALSLMEGMPDFKATTREDPEVEKKKKKKQKKVEPKTVEFRGLTIRRRRALKRAAAATKSVGYRRAELGGCLVWRPRPKQPQKVEAIEVDTDDALIQAVGGMPTTFLTVLRESLESPEAQPGLVETTGEKTTLSGLGETALVAWDLNQDVAHVDFATRRTQVEARVSAKKRVRHVAVLHPFSAARKRWADRLPAAFDAVLVSRRKDALLPLVRDAKPHDLLVCSRSARLAETLAPHAARCVRLHWGSNRHPASEMVEEETLAAPAAPAARPPPKRPASRSRAPPARNKRAKLHSPPPQHGR